MGDTPLSLIGGTEAIEMKVFPRLLFLFQCLPVRVPMALINALDKLITRFIWQDKKPGVRLKTQEVK